MTAAADSIAAKLEPQNPAWGRLRAGSWGVSGLLHAVLMLLLALMLGGERAPAEPPDRPAGIALVTRNELGEEEYLLESDIMPADVTGEVPAGDSPVPPAAAAPIDLDGFLPSRTADGGLGLPAGLGKIVLSGSRPTLGGGGDRPEDIERVRKPGPPGPQVRLNLFDGVEAEGNRFVFVLDRSNSMGAAHLAILHKAKREILAQIDRLDDRHKFQIIAYNNRLDYFNRGGLLAAGDRNTRQAHKFVDGVTAGGGTKHYLAIASALRMKPPPDAIFVLTDADVPHPTGSELAELRRRAAGRCTINVVQFGDGPLDASDNFFTRLARETGGVHGYLDVTSRSGLVKP